MNSHQFARLFPLGSHLCREPMPAMSELKRDMEILKRQGFNLIKLQEHWMIDEPVEGRYDFSRYEELIEHAARLDLGVYLGLTCEQAPLWLYRKHPGAHMVGRDGRPIVYTAVTTLPSDGKPGPCFDDPGAMAAQLRFITRLVQTLGRHENIVVWNTWQEIGYWSDSLIGNSVCFCDHTLAHFRRWLTGRYGDLDALNRAWNTRYADWPDIVPSRAAGAKRTAAVDVFWQYFMDNVQVAHVLKQRAEAVRAADPFHRPVFAHKAASLIGAGQDWTYARCQDFLGSSSYPAWFCLQGWDDGKSADRQAALLGERWGIALNFDYIRCANPPGKPVWAAEFQGGPVNTGFHRGRVPSAADIRAWMLTAMSVGVTGISFWVTRAEIMAAELNGFSLLDSEGDATPRLDEAGRVGRALHAHPDLFGQPTLERARVGILVNEWNYQFCAAQSDRHQAYNLRGWHRLLWDAGIPMDFVEVSEFDDRYDALILPFPMMLGEEVAAKLARYVEQGGTLISEACPGRVDAHSFANRGELSPTLRTLFGVDHAGVAMVREPEGGQRWSYHERTWGEFLEPATLAGVGPLSGHSVRANFYLETFTPRGSEVCLRHGEQVAGTVRTVGKGRAWLLGTFIGHNGTAYRNEPTQQCVRALLASGGVTAAHSGKLLLRKRVSGSKEAWIFTNPTPEPVTERIHVGVRSGVTSLLGEPVTRDGEAVTLTVDSLDVVVLILT